MSGFDDGGAMPPAPPPPPSAGGGGAIPPRGLGDILSAAFELYRANAAKLITIVAVVVVPLTFLTALFTSMLTDNVQKLADTIQVDPNTGQVTTTSTVGTSFGNAILLSLLVALISFLIQYLLTGALTRGAAGSIIGREVDVKASYGYAFSRLLPLIGLALLVGIVVAIGFVLLIIPGIIFAVFLAMAVPAFVIERLGVTASMSRSWNLVKGYWWHTLAVTVVAALIAGVITRVLGAIGGTSFIGVWITSAIGQIITAPFVALVAVLLYVDLRARHEGLTAGMLGQQIDDAHA